METPEQSALRPPESPVGPPFACQANGAALPQRETSSTGSRWQRLVLALRSSTWLPIVGRGAAITLFMLGFAAIGTGATLVGPPGVHLASQATPSTPVTWLAPTSGEPTETASATASVETRPPTPVSLRPDCQRDGSLCEQHAEPQDPPGLTRDGKVILNTASATVLTRLPGVGERRAQAIVELRTRLKRFRRTTDLLRVRGIGVRSLKRMLPYLVLNPPEPEPDAGPPSKP